MNVCVICLWMYVCVGGCVCVCAYVRLGTCLLDNLLLNFVKCQKALNQTTRLTRQMPNMRTTLSNIIDICVPIMAKYAICTPANGIREETNKENNKTVILVTKFGRDLHANDKGNCL